MVNLPEDHTKEENGLSLLYQPSAKALQGWGSEALPSTMLDADWLDLVQTSCCKLMTIAPLSFPEDTLLSQPSLTLAIIIFPTSSSVKSLP